MGDYRDQGFPKLGLPFLFGGGDGGGVAIRRIVCWVYFGVSLSRETTISKIDLEPIWKPLRTPRIHHVGNISINKILPFLFNASFSQAYCYNA